MKTINHLAIVILALLLSVSFATNSFSGPKVGDKQKNNSASIDVKFGTHDQICPAGCCNSGTCIGSCTEGSCKSASGSINSRGKNQKPDVKYISSENVKTSDCKETNCCK